MPATHLDVSSKHLISDEQLGKKHFEGDDKEIAAHFAIEVLLKHVGGVRRLSRHYKIDSKSSFRGLPEVEFRQNNIKNRIRRSLGSIFNKFAMVLGALAVILDVLGSSVLELHFERILKTSGCGHQFCRRHVFLQKYVPEFWESIPKANMAGNPAYPS